MRRMLREVSGVVAFLFAAAVLVAAVLHLSGCSAEQWAKVGKGAAATTQAVNGPVGRAVADSLPFGNLISGAITAVAAVLGAVAKNQHSKHKEDHIARQKLEAENAELKGRLTRRPQAAPAAAATA